MDMTKENVKYLSENFSFIKTNIINGEDHNIFDQDKVIVTIGTSFEKLFGPNWWNLMKSLASRSCLEGTGFRYRYECVARNSNLKTDVGRGRLFLKHLLDLQLLSRVVKTVTCLGMYPSSTVLGSSDYRDKVVKMTVKIDAVKWTKLMLSSDCWLDVTWDIPVEIVHEFVPASDLGVCVVMVGGWPVVTSVAEASVAAEDGKVERGDVVTHINGVNVTGPSHTVDKLVSLVSKSKGKPITIKVTKCFDVSKGTIVSAVLPLLKSVGIDTEELQRSHFLTHGGLRKNVGMSVDDDFNPLEDSDDEQQMTRIGTRGSGHTCLYLGSVNVGCSGNFDRIEFGITRVLNSLNDACGHISVLQLADMDIRLFNQITNDLILRYVYPQIASCGRLVSKPNYFAFISLPDSQEISGKD